MKRKLQWIALILMMFALVAGTSLLAQRGSGGRGMMHPQLTQDQRTQVHELVSQMHNDGATREEIHAKVQELFASWGIQMPDPGQMRGMRGGRGAGFALPQLTEEQRAELQAKHAELRAANASREEIHAAIAALFQSWGLEAPQFGPRAGFGRHMAQRGDFIDENTTAEQRKELYAKHDELWEAGATDEEMRDAMHTLLTSWGIELPDTTGHPGFGMQREAHEDQLTVEQRVEVRAKIKEMRIAGKSREEIHDAVAEILKGYGIELPERPENPRGGQGFRGRGHGGPDAPQKPELSDEQRAALYANEQELRAAGATHAEMREARQAMLAEWGFTPPDTPRDGRQLRGGKGRGNGGGIQARNFPNPFNPETTISYTLESAGPVKVSVFNLQGQVLQVLYDGNQSAGEHTMRWDGKLANGEAASSGTYLYRIETAGQITTNKMILMK